MKRITLVRRRVKTRVSILVIESDFKLYALGGGSKLLQMLEAFGLARHENEQTLKLKICVQN